MKLTGILIAVAIIIALLWFFKINNKDNAARKDAKIVTATIEKVRCEQHLKSDKSLVVVNYQGKSYSVFFKNAKECEKYTERQQVSAYYSDIYDKLFLDL